jgi:hypothetical protein
MSRQFVTIAQAPEHNIPGTAKSLHWVAFHREYNGAEKAGAIVKFGGRLYIDPTKFLEWMATGPRISPPVQRNKPSTVNRQKPKQLRALKVAATALRDGNAADKIATQ